MRSRFGRMLRTLSKNPDGIDDATVDMIFKVEKSHDTKPAGRCCGHLDLESGFDSFELRVIEVKKKLSIRGNCCLRIRLLDRRIGK